MNTDRVQIAALGADQPLPTGGIPVTPRLLDAIGTRLPVGVIAGLQEREAIGIQRYGSPLCAGNGRDALRDLHEELLDGIHYAAQAAIEAEEAGTWPGPLWDLAVALGYHAAEVKKWRLLSAQTTNTDLDPVCQSVRGFGRGE